MTRKKENLRNDLIKFSLIIYYKINIYFIIYKCLLIVYLIITPKAEVM